MLFHYAQETENALKGTEEDALTDQTSAKMESTQSYDNGFILDLTSSSDNIAEVREIFSCFLILFPPLIYPIFNEMEAPETKVKRKELT